MFQKFQNIALFLLLATPLMASHNMAGEVFFTKLNALKVEVQVVTYTRASSVQADRDTILVNWGDGTVEQIVRANGDGDSLTLNTKRSIYIGYHQYAANGVYRISFTDPNRVEGILNINFPNSELVVFYLEAMLHLTPDAQASTHSPKFLEYPVDFGTVGMPFLHVLNAFDLDGDSLAYELAMPLSDSITVVPNYLFPNEILPGDSSQLYLDAYTGELIWDAPQIAGFYSVTIRVKSYRDGQLVEETLRDMVIVILAEDNNPPVLAVDLQENIIHEVSLGQMVEVNATAVDMDSNQLVYLSATSGLLDTFFQQTAIFDATTGKFSWTVTAEHIRNAPYDVVFKARDDFDASGGASTFKILRFKTMPVSDVAEQIGVTFSVDCFPNPISETATIKLWFMGKTQANITLFDGLGRVLWNRNDIFEAGESTVVLGEGYLKLPGTYILCTTTPIGRKTKKLICVN